jgi:protein ImuA
MTSLKHAQLAALRRQLMNETVLGPAPTVAPLGVAAIDATLPWRGLPCGVLHEVSGAAMDGAATGFCALLLARLAGSARSVLWVCADDDLYGPGLAALGLPLDRLILVRARKQAEILWTIEEALRCRGLAAVLGEIADLPLAAGRRLQLAARKSGVTALLLRPRADNASTPAVTRWRVAAVPEGAARNTNMITRWRVDLVRCRGLLHGEEGHVQRWLVEWNRAARHLAVVPDLRDRPPVPAPRRMAG